MFHFKQFSVDQSGCAMKINTDGVLLGAVTEAENPLNILDIGTGTGVIALMLAQKFPYAKVTAVEIDEVAAQTARENFDRSPFNDRLEIYPLDFETYFNNHREDKYDLIVSNPPFYINSLKSPGAKKTIAKHSDIDFFEKLIKNVSSHLSPTGSCWLITPVNIAQLVLDLATEANIFLQKRINIQSYPHSEINRIIFSVGFVEVSPQISNLTVYLSERNYSDHYKTLLQPYFIAF